MTKLSLVVPCYNEEQSVPLLYKEVALVCKELWDKYSLDHEIIFVNDGSKDNTLSKIKEIKKSDNKVKYISFSRNFGKEAAIYAGLSESTGDYVVLLDADLQHPPKNIITMYEELLNNSDLDSVAYRRISRKGEPFFRSLCSKTFYFLINIISDTPIIPGATEFRMMSRQMTDSVLSLCEHNRFSKGIFNWVGFNTKWLSYKNVSRVAGKTKWSFIGLIIYSLYGIMSFSTFPIDFSLFLGIFIFILGLIWFLLTVILSCSNIWIIISAVTFLSGIQLICIGLLGQYLSKTYTEVKNRPAYIIKERG